MDTRTLLRERLRRARDWAAVIDELEKELEGSGGKPDQSERLFELARLVEDVIPERERALGLYQRAWKLHPDNLKALSRVSGIGKRTAERLVLELREKVAEIAPADQVAGLALPSDDVIGGWVSDVEIEEEKIAATRYIGRYTIRFAAAPIAPGTPPPSGARPKAQVIGGVSFTDAGGPGEVWLTEVADRDRRAVILAVRYLAGPDRRLVREVVDRADCPTANLTGFAASTVALTA